MRQIDNMTPQEIDTLALKGITADNKPYRRVTTADIVEAVNDSDRRDAVWAKRLAKALGERDHYKAHADKMAEALRGVQWKITAYGSHWEPSQAEREAIANTLAAYESEAQ